MLIKIKITNNLTEQIDILMVTLNFIVLLLYYLLFFTENHIVYYAYKFLKMYFIDPIQTGDCINRFIE